MEQLTAKLNHFLRLKRDKGLSLNEQLVAHPDFHAPGITETLVAYMNIDPWTSRSSGTPLPWEEAEEPGAFDYAKVAADQRAAWEASAAPSQKTVNFQPAQSSKK